MSESNLIALVTGANQGIGLATAHVLSQRGYTVIMACRDPSKAVDAVKAWSDTEQQQARPFKLDLADLSSVKKFARKIQKKFKHIDALILNAGVSPESYQKTPQNLELTFQVNHLGHFYLTKLLLPLVKASPQGRVVSLSSALWRAPDLNNLQRTDLEGMSAFGGFQKIKLYGQTKAMNYLFIKHLAHILAAENSHVTANAVDPGMVHTSMSQRFMPGLGFLWSAVLKIFSTAPSDGSQTSVFVATSPSISKLAKQLWDLSEQLLSDTGFGK